MPGEDVEISDVELEVGSKDQVSRDHHSRPSATVPRFGFSSHDHPSERRSFSGSGTAPEDILFGVGAAFMRGCRSVIPWATRSASGVGASWWAPVARLHAAQKQFSFGWVRACVSVLLRRAMEGKCNLASAKRSQNPDIAYEVAAAPVLMRLFVLTSMGQRLNVSGAHESTIVFTFDCPHLRAPEAVTAHFAAGHVNWT
jgi:hypothetical protein